MNDGGGGGGGGGAALSTSVVRMAIILSLVQRQVSPKERIIVHWKCDCRDVNVDIDDVPRHTTCHTHGVDPQQERGEQEQGENTNDTQWSFSKVAVSEVVGRCFMPHNKTLKEVSISKMKYIDEFEKGMFDDLANVQAVTISNTPALRFLPMGIFIPLKLLRVLRMTHTGLEELPVLPALSLNIMHIVDFESNKITVIRSNALTIQTEQLILDYNDIKKIEGWAFNGSQIGKLSLKGNRALAELSSDAFRGLRSLRDLDLSETSITFLPVLGLESLEALILTGTDTLKIIPSIHDLKSLLVAKLTYSFHCCAFKYPKRHDPHRHELHEEYLARAKELCTDTTSTFIRAKRIPEPGVDRRSGRSVDGRFGPIIIGEAAGTVSSADGVREIRNRPDRPSMPNAATGPGAGSREIPSGDGRGPAGVGGGTDTKPWPWPGPGPGPGAAESSSGGGPSDDEVWGEAAVFGGDARTPYDGTPKLKAVCGNLIIRREPVECYPKPDALNPCEDIMGYNWLRISIWLVISTALFGNTAVLVVLIANRSDTNVPRFLMMNLAFSDLLMAVYLLLLGLSDLQSTGVYFNYAYDWQRGYGCKLAGVLTVFSSQLSVYTLSLITIERWFAIKHALHANKLDLKVASYAMLIGWFYSVVIAILPLFGISSYSSTSICLPMDIQTMPSLIYVLLLLLFTGVAFILICVCYIQIYSSLGKETRHCPGETSVARKMMLLVGTNFACCAPVAFFSLTAVAGYPLIDVTKSKILLVFFYPINSCANPYLYAIMTSQYRKQLIQLLSRCGLCTEFAQQYKLVYSPENKNVSKHEPNNVKTIHKEWIQLSKSTITTEDPV